MRVLILMLSVAGAIAVTPVFGQEQATEKPVKLQELPPAVQEVVKAQGKSATVRGFSKEVKDGRTLYEIEMRVNGLYQGPDRRRPGGDRQRRAADDVERDP